MSRALYHTRKVRNVVALGLSMFAAATGLIILALILATLFINGFAAIKPSIFMEMTPPPGEEGGLLNAIYGSLMLTFVGIITGTPLGIMAGTFLAEYGNNSKLAQTIRFINDILLSAPSIAIGIFIYEIMVAPMGHFSGWAGSGGYRRSRRRPHHRRHAQACSQYAARVRLGAGHAEVARDQLGVLPGRQKRHDHRRAACSGADFG